MTRRRRRDERDDARGAAPRQRRLTGDGAQRPDYGRGQWGVREEAGWRGPGVGPDYREAQGRPVPFQSRSVGGQIPGEVRQWRGGQRAEQGGPPELELAGLRGPDAYRSAAGQRRDLAGGPHAGRGPKNYRRSDERIWGELCDRLTAAPDVDASDIEVEVKEGRIVLRGTVPDRRTKHRAEDIAEDVLGATDVDNELRVRRAEAPAARAGSPAGQPSPH